MKTSQNKMAVRELKAREIKASDYVITKAHNHQLLMMSVKDL